MRTHFDDEADKPSVHVDQRFWLDVRRRGPGWEYVVGATHATERRGWRLTKRSAKRAGKRLMQRLDRHH